VGRAGLAAVLGALTFKNETGFIVSPRLSSGGRFSNEPQCFFGRRPLRVPEGLLSYGSKLGSCWSSRERRASPAAPLDGIASEHDGERLPTLSVAIPPVRSILRGMSVAPRR
jgi:hypothetical protein